MTSCDDMWQYVTICEVTSNKYTLLHFIFVTILNDYVAIRNYMLPYVQIVPYSIDWPSHGHLCGKRDAKGDIRIFLCSEYWWSLTMTITNVTVKDQTGSYVCKVNRSDYTSPFEKVPAEMPLHSIRVGQEVDPLSVVKPPYYTPQNVSLAILPDGSTVPLTVLRLFIRPHPGKTLRFL